MDQNGESTLNNDQQDNKNSLSIQLYKYTLHNLGLHIFPFSYFEDIIPPFFLKKKNTGTFIRAPDLMTSSLYSFCNRNYSYLCLQRVVTYKFFSWILIFHFLFLSVWFETLFY
jgi:hypothetical protein